MDFKNSNLINLFRPAKINNHSLSLLVSVFLPAAFITKNVESTLIYLMLYFVFIVLVTLVSKLIELVSPNEIKWLLYILSLVGIAVLLSVFQEAMFVNYSKDYTLYTYLLPSSALPYMLIADNKEKSLGKSMLNSLESFIGFLVIMLFVSLFREVIGTGMITFGYYTNISFTFDLFSKYAITTFQNSLGALIILGFLFALINSMKEEL